MIENSRGFHAPTSPDFLIIGAQKAGSTWLYDVLKAHRDVFLPEQIELHHFNKLNCEDPAAIEAYLENFSAAAPGQRVGEKSTGYFWNRNPARSESQPHASHNPEIPASVRRILGPDLQLIVSLRHPVQRAISAYGHHGRRKRIPAGTPVRDVAGRLGILDIGFYADHLAAWERVFDPAQILVTIFEQDIVRNPMDGYRSVCAFLGVRSDEPPPRLTQCSNKGLSREIVADRITFDMPGLAPVTPADVHFLLEAYADEMSRLAARFGDRIACWEEETERLRHFAARAVSV